MKAFIPVLAAVFIAGLALYLWATAAHAEKTGKEIAFRWEWPAERKADEKILVKIQRISKKEGLIPSPSFADALPDALEIKATVLKGPERFIGKMISLTAPGAEVKTLKTEGQAILGILRDENICLCAVGTDPNDPKSEELACR